MKKPREKVLVVTRNLPPLVGGMERLVWHVVDALHFRNSSIAHVSFSNETLQGKPASYCFRGVRLTFPNERRLVLH